MTSTACSELESSASTHNGIDGTHTRSKRTLTREEIKQYWRKKYEREAPCNIVLDAVNF